MKKIVGILGAAAMLASSVFAVNFSARVYMTGDIAGGNIDTDNSGDGNVNFLKVNSENQKDADALIMSVDNGNAGANFQFWYQFTGVDADTENVHVRGTNLWFKPVDSFKVKIGALDTGTYKEMLHWWKDPVGGKLADWKSWGAKYSSSATVNGTGAEFEWTPMAGLWVSGGVTPGAGTNFAAVSDKAFSTTAWGLAVKYSNIADLPLSAGVSWRDDGVSIAKSTWKDDAGAEKVEYKNSIKAKVLAVGFDYGNPWANGFYAMVNCRMRFEEDKKADVTSIAMNGLTIDNYFKYTAGALVAQARLPVTIRFVEGEETYMCWSAKVQYAVNALTPYVLFGSDLDNDGAWTFNDKFVDNMNLEIQPGVAFNVGSCGLDIGLRVNLDAGMFKDGKDIRWSVPFTASVAF